MAYGEYNDARPSHGNVSAGGLIVLGLLGAVLLSACSSASEPRRAPTNALPPRHRALGATSYANSYGELLFAPPALPNRRSAPSSWCDVQQRGVQPFVSPNGRGLRRVLASTGLLCLGLLGFALGATVGRVPTDRSTNTPGEAQRDTSLMCVQPE